jgi:hypothetical protein
MAYSSLNFAGYEDMRRGTIDNEDLEEGTVRQLVHTECKDLFDGMAKHITRYAATKQNQKLTTLFEMIQDGCNMSIDMLTKGSGPGEQDAGNG